MGASRLWLSGALKRNAMASFVYLTGTPEICRKLVPIASQRAVQIAREGRRDEVWSKSDDGLEVALSLSDSY
jgi:hypothetical protein